MKWVYHISLARYALDATMQLQFHGATLVCGNVTETACLLGQSVLLPDNSSVPLTWITVNGSSTIPCSASDCVFATGKVRSPLFYILYIHVYCEFA